MHFYALRRDNPLHKRAIAGAIAAAVFTLCALSPAYASPAPPLHGRAAVLLDGISGQVLYQENGSDMNYPASTTKLLTALVAAQRGRLEQTITVTPEAVALPPDSSTCWLQAGEQQSLEDLLYGLLLPSGNDCAAAIAEGVGNGDADQFVKWMNETARELGATHSQFTNPHGYHDPNHYTTAMDLALISRAALQNPTVLRISGTPEYYWPGKSELNGTYLNHNEMLALYPDTVGGKTGFTDEARRTLVNAAQRGDRLLIGVLMGEEDREQQYQDMIDLLDYGFSQFTQRELLVAGTYPSSLTVVDGAAQEVAVAPATGYKISVPQSGTPTVRTTVEAPEQLTAPIRAGQEVGSIEVREGERLLAKVPLLAQADVPEQETVWAKGLAVALTVLKWLGIALAAFLLFRFAVRLTRRTLRRRNRYGSARRSRLGRTGTIDAYRPRRPDR